MTRLKSLSVRGFRAFGAAEQTLKVPTDIATVWGPNSKGKTSLGEAFEFLLTGSLSRRELLASSQDEFADAIRNVHLADGTEVYVKAKIIDANNNEHTIKRVLLADYGKKQNCQSRLEIDGVVSDQAALSSLGIILSQPPLAAPVLAQHTLSYIFSVGPQNRSTYFKALLEVADLDDLRNEIAGAAGQVHAPDSPLLAKFDKCAALVPLAPSIGTLRTTIPDQATTNSKIHAAAAALIAGAGEPVPQTTADRIATVERLLADRRAKTFPVAGFERSDLPSWTAPPATSWKSLETYLVERGEVDAETRHLVALFDEALKLPSIALAAQPIACPLCATEGALTPERVQLIRGYVEDTKDFKKAETAAKTTLSDITTSAAALMNAADAVLPQYLRQKPKARRRTGFTVARLHALLDAAAADVVPPWLEQVRSLFRASRRLRTAAHHLKMLAEAQNADIETALVPGDLQAAVAVAEGLRQALVAAIEAYKAPAQRLEEVLNHVLDAQSDTAGWQEFVDVARQPETLREALIERKAYGMLAQEVDAALKKIDQAKEQVLEDKFAEYSGTIQAWWERLRPDEPTFFSAVKPRKGAKRTIDFKAGLSPNADRSAPKMRDVIAVFSQSQLHCLGLALFLARAEQDGGGFIILDDPVLSSDEDYRAHFNTSVVEALVAIPIQVVVITQDHKTWTELETRYRHVGISTAQLLLDDPRDGTVIENTSEELLTMLTRAKSLARGGHPGLRKDCGLQLRDAGERFCKEMLVRDRRSKGVAAAALADYDGKCLEWLCPRVEPLLDHDPSHPGKLEAFRNTVNDACHDNEPPSTGSMKQACGEITFLVKEYLGLGQ